MSDVRRNTPDTDAAYLAALNACFPGWGDERQYAWAYERDIGGGPADRLMVVVDERLVAGAALVYRTLQLPDGTERKAAIISGAWTLPEARGRGHWGALAAESGPAAAANGAELVLAFVTADNPSKRGLDAARYSMYETCYVAGRPTPTGKPPPTELVDPMSAYEQVVRLGRAGTSIAYPSPEAWTAQFFGRSTPTEATRVDGLGMVVIEHHPNAPRVLALVAEPGVATADLARAALGSAGTVSMFFAEPGEGAAVAEALGITPRRGYLAALATTGPQPQPTLSPLALHSGDRM